MPLIDGGAFSFFRALFFVIPINDSRSFAQTRAMDDRVQSFVERQTQPICDKHCGRVDNQCFRRYCEKDDRKGGYSFPVERALKIPANENDYGFLLTGDYITSREWAKLQAFGLMLLVRECQEARHDSIP